jgi:type I restriction enzyme, S subunit
VTRLKHVATIIAGQSPASDDVSVLADGAPFLQGNAEFGDKFPLPRYECEAAVKRSREGDVLLSVRAPVGAVNVADRDYGIGRGLCAVRARSIDPGYLWWWLQDAKPQLASVATGSTFSAVTAGDVGALVIPIEALDVQCFVARYLDEEVTKVDGLITEQKGLVSVLRERRSALITRAVTKGLNPDAPVRETGVASLGAIPAHWRVQRVKHLGRAIIGLTYSPDEIVDSEQDGTLVLRAGNIQQGRLTLGDNVYVSTPIPAELRARAGDILICARNGSARLIGKNAVIGTEVEGETWGAFMAVLRSPSNFYLRWILNSQLFTAQIGMFSTSTINQLTSGTLHNLEIAVPPTAEMKQIADYLDRETEAIDNLIAEAEKVVAVARERRAALITAAVTGQIDVRGEVA